MIPMNYYEIKNIKTQETAQTTAKNFSTACKEQGWKPSNCRCIWKARTENTCDQSNY